MVLKDRSSSSMTENSTSSSNVYNNNNSVVVDEIDDNDDDNDDDVDNYNAAAGTHTQLVETQRLPREVRNLLAGGVAGMVAKSVVAPVDRIKILYQTSSLKFKLTNVPQVAMSIIKNEGIEALWKGNIATMIRVFPYSGIQFMVFDRCKHYFLQFKNIPSPSHHIHTTTTTNNIPGTSPAKRRYTKRYNLTPLESLMAGSAAGAVSVTCTYPLDLTRAQLAVMKKHGKDGITQKNYNFVDVLIQNYKRGGIKGLFRGIQPTLLGILPYSGAAFMINEQSKSYISKQFQREPTNIEKMQCGALSGLCAQTLTYPFEVTRRRMQTIGLVPSKEAAQTTLLAGEKATANTSNNNKAVSMISTMRALWIEQGIQGFFKGVSMNWLKGPIAFSISFTTFDIVKTMMETNDEHFSRTGHYKNK